VLNVLINHDKKAYNYYALTITFIIIVGISGLKSINVGSDTPVYANLFYNSINEQVSLSNLFTQRFEGGYVYLNQILFKIYPHVQILFIVVSVITIFCWLFVIDKLSNNISISIFLFFTFGLFSLLLSNLRQSLAMALVILAFYLLYKNHLILSVCLILLAGTFHISAFIFLGYLILRKIKINKTIIISAIIVSVGGYISFNKILSVGTSLFSKYSSYIENNVLAGETKVLSTITFGILVVTFILGNIIIKKSREKEDIYLQQLNLLILFACVFSFVAIQTSSFNRLTNYFSMFIIFYIPKILSLIKQTSTRFILAMLIVFSFFLYNFIIMYYRPEWNYIVPYSTFWQTIG